MGKCVKEEIKKLEKIHKKENKTRAEEEKKIVSKNEAKEKVNKKRQGKRKKEKYEGNGKKGDRERRGRIGRRCRIRGKTQGDGV